MKTTLLAFAFGVSLIAQGQLVNGGFEEWDEITFDHPVGPEIPFTSSNFETVYLGGDASVFQVSGFADSWMRVESSLVNDEAIGGYAIWGNPPQGDDLLFTGGFPFNDANATGIVCDLNYDINPASPGFLIVQFQFEGVPVGGGNIGPGTYFFPISGEEVGFQQTEFLFDPPIGVSVDQCVIGFASNNLVDDEAEIFPDDFLEVNNLAFLNSDATIPGGDFEEWTPVESFFLPVGWVSLDAFFLNLYERTEDAYSGSYAMKMNTIQVGEEILAAFVAQGAPTEEGFIPNIPVEEGFMGFSFQYKYEIEQEDEAFAIFFMSENENPVPDDVIFWGTPLAPTDEYTFVTEDFTEILELVNINYVGVAFLSSWNTAGKGEETTAQAGSSLFLDDVTILYETDPCDIVVEIEQGSMLMLCPGETTVVSVEDNYETYQWYRQMMFGGEVELLDGETTNTLEVNDFDFSVYNVWCEVTFDDCVVESTTIGIDGWVFAPTVIASDITSICEGESTSIEALGASGTVAWYLNGSLIEGENSNPLTITEGGTYVASIFPTDCPETEISSGVGVTITVNPNPEPEIVGGDDGDLMTTLTYESYQWYINDELIEGATNQSIDIPGNGVYTVVVTDSNGCVGEANVTISRVSDLEGQPFEVYPNPAVNEIRVSKVNGHYEIFDLTGRMVEQGTLFDTAPVISIAHLAHGVYILNTPQGSVRFMKQ